MPKNRLLLNRSTNLNLRLALTLWKNLLKPSLKNTNIVINHRLLIRRVILAHNTNQCEIPVHNRQRPRQLQRLVN
jgi:hypothetical protein